MFANNESSENISNVMYVVKLGYHVCFASSILHDIPPFCVWSHHERLWRNHKWICDMQSAYC